MPRSSAIPAAVLLAVALASAGGGEPPANPAGRMKVAETRKLWAAPAGDSKIGAGQARFSPDGKRLAWALGGSDAPAGQVMVADLVGGKTDAVWIPPEPGRVTHLAWSSSGSLAACVGWAKGEAARRKVVLLPAGAEKAGELEGTDGAKVVAWRADGKALAYAADEGLFLFDLASGKPARLLEAPKAWRLKGDPAFDDMVFYRDSVLAREAGSARWWLCPPDGRPAFLGEFRGVCPDPERGRIYVVPWLTGPAGIPRGAGVAWLDPAAEKPEPQTIVPDRPAESGGKPYWLVDVWDWHYFSTLRVSADGKSVTFCGVKAGEPAANAWREFCIWRAPTDGSALPKVLCEMGPIFKRIDASGRDWVIGWRYALDNVCVLAHLGGGRAWRMPKDFEVQRVNTDVRPDLWLVGAARGKEVVVMRLEEDK